MQEETAPLTRAHLNPQTTPLRKPQHLLTCPLKQLQRTPQILHVRACSTCDCSVIEIVLLQWVIKLLAKGRTVLARTAPHQVCELMHTWKYMYVSVLYLTIEFENLKPPPIMRKRGRPKGAEKTVIGLPRCKRFKGDQVRKPVAFLKKTTANREEGWWAMMLRVFVSYMYNLYFSVVMLSWFLDRHVKEAVLARKRLVLEEDVEVRPERIPATCLDEDVCIQSIRKYFSTDAWCTLTNVLDVLRSNLVWYCGLCAKEMCDETENSIKCDSCLTWFHFQCVGIKTGPKAKEWFCRHCRSSAC